MSISMENNNIKHENRENRQNIFNQLTLHRTVCGGQRIRAIQY